MGLNAIQAITPSTSHSLTVDSQSGTEEQIAQLPTEFNDLVNTAINTLGLTQETAKMIPIDISDQHPVVMIAAVNQTSSAIANNSSSAVNKIKVAGICAPIPNAPNSEKRYYGTDLEIITQEYFGKFEHREVSGAIEVSLLESPKHGKFETDPNGFAYYPEENYFGDDRMTYLVKLGSETVKFVIFLKMVPTNTFGNTGEEKACQPKGFLWKISSLPTGSNPTTITYSNLLNGALGAFKGFTDLPAGEVGNTVGEGANASITLDINAAGNGWFMDSTPFSNEEFLPTADANIEAVGSSLVFCLPA